MSRSGERYGEFTTSGGTIWVTARLPPTGGFLPEITRTRIEVGFADNPPSYDSRTGEEDAEIEADVSVEEGVVGSLGAECWPILALVDERCGSSHAQDLHAGGNLRSSPRQL